MRGIGLWDLVSLYVEPLVWPMMSFVGVAMLILSWAGLWIGCSGGTKSLVKQAIIEVRHLQRTTAMFGAKKTTSKRKKGACTLKCLATSVNYDVRVSRVVKRKGPMQGGTF